ncbi:hypothetical protein D3C87_517920 [compost metagenome]
MIRTVYKIKNEKGEYFAGPYSVKRFNAVGKCYETLKELSLDITRVSSVRDKASKIDKLFEDIEIVKEEQTITEIDAEVSIDVIHERLKDRHKIVNNIRRISGVRGVWPSTMAHELEIMFPTWELGDFRYIMFVDTYRVNPNKYNEVLKDLVKTIGCKRTQCVRGDRVLAFKELKFVTASKLVLGNIIEYLDLEDYRNVGP